MPRRIPSPAGYHWDVREPIVRADGARPCRACKGPLAGRRRSFCSDACVGWWLRRTRPAVLAAEVFARDRGICAACGSDVAPFDVRWLQLQLHRSDLWYRGDADRRRRLEGRVELGPDGTPWPPEHWAGLIPAAVAWHRRLGLDVYRRPWDVDHVTPLVLGGDPFAPGNLRTLCVPCHRRVTIELNAGLLAARRVTSRGVSHVRPG